MKITVVLVILAFCSWSCSKEVVSTEADEATALQKGFVEASFQQDFLTDYVINGKHRVKGRPSDAEWALYDLIGTSDPKVLDNQYQQVRRNLHQLLDRHPDKSMDHVVQRVYLKYLREVYLPHSNKAHRLRIVEILDELMKTEPMDLDVIADAYFEVEDLLAPDQRQAYFRQMLQLYRSDRDYIFQEAKRMKKVYDGSDAADERAFALMSIKQLERRSDALKYVDEKFALGESAGAGTK